MMKIWLVAAAALSLGACQSSSTSAPEPQSGAVRASVVTAPADLQLLCATEAQTRLGASDVLPVSSSQTEPGRYTVLLSAGGGQASCVVTDEGVIESIA
ncbi:hypothetical protein [Acuticoccus yangtzensis]|uniref:hypothetical protein n=1 Tax=Acuticoccus yangtzensis TaxID=1443441 RepID=UPI0009F7F6ED|nr:hypothetical protein [Acuticoccus yangtzensis]ORE94338.1 hypothetical protein ATO13_09696 [Stappia sp. 22II-S9-Z10]